MQLQGYAVKPYIDLAYARGTVMKPTATESKNITASSVAAGLKMQLFSYQLNLSYAIGRKKEKKSTKQNQIKFTLSHAF